MGFAGLTSSTSRQDASTHEITQNAGGYAVIGRGKGSINTTGDVIKLGKGAKLYQTFTDHGAIQAANSAVMAAINSQSKVTDQAVMGYGGLAETKITDGANLTAKSNTIVIAVIGLVVSIVAFLYLRKH